MADQVIIDILKALADPTRLDIVRELVQEGKKTRCADVRKCSDLSQPAMSHHFSKLAEAGVIIEHKDGKEKVYELNQELLRAHGIDTARL